MRALDGLRRVLGLCRQERFSTARAELRTLLGGGGIRAQWRLPAALLLFVTRDFGEALDQLDRWAAEAPDRAARPLRERLEMCLRLGWLHEARESLDRGIELAPDPTSWLLRGLALHNAVRDDAGASSYVQRALRLRPGDPGLLLEAARLLNRLGRYPDGARTAKQALRRGAGDDAQVAVFRRLVESGRLGEADAVARRRAESQPHAAAPLAELARLAHWRGDLREGRRLVSEALRKDPACPGALREQGVNRTLGGEPGAAEADLRRAVTLDPADDQAWVWLGDALGRMGDLDGAVRAIDRGLVLGGGRNPTAFVLRQSLVIRRDNRLPLRDGRMPADGSQVGPMKTERSRLKTGVSPRKMLQELGGLIRAVRPDLEPAVAAGEPLEVLAALDQVLDRLSGNRSCTPTVPDPASPAGLRRAFVPEAPREQSRRVLELIRLLPAEQVLARFAEVKAAHPESTMPDVHRGEMLLWLGRTEEADRDFERCIAADRGTRWAYIGRQAVEIVRGDYAASLAQAERGVCAMDHTAGPTLFTYKGEALMALGRLDEAADQLSEAVRRHPSRVGARVLWGLCLGRLGHDADQIGVLRGLMDLAPGLLSDAARMLGLELWRDPDSPAPEPDERRAVLEQALVLLKANRSSSCVTYFGERGQLRTVPGVREEEAQVALWRRYVATDLERVGRLLSSGAARSDAAARFAPRRLSPGQMGGRWRPSGAVAGPRSSPPAAPGSHRRRPWPSRPGAAARPRP